MRKIYLKLTEEQKRRGIIFTSTLSYHKTDDRADNTHEVYESDKDKNATIKRLLDDSFFNKSQFKYNIIRQ